MIETETAIVTDSGAELMRSTTHNEPETMTGSMMDDRELYHDDERSSKR